MVPIVACVHTGVRTVDLIAELGRELLPGVRLVHLMDDGVVQDAVVAGRVDQQITRRMGRLYVSAAEAGATVILLCCSTVGETAEVGERLVSVPIVRIDEPMAEQAVATARRVALIATIESTLGPSGDLFRRKAAATGRSVEIDVRLCSGALDLLKEGKNAEHDRLVVEAIREAAREVDVVALAQASMTRVLPLVGDVGVPVLASPRPAVLRIGAMLAALAG